MIVILEPGTDKTTYRTFGSLENIEALAFNLRFGGNSFGQPVRITEEFIAKLSQMAEAFPLYIPSTCKTLRYFMSNFKDIPQFAFFQTAFFLGLPEKEKHYPVAGEYFSAKEIVKWGYDGIYHGANSEIAGGNGKTISVVLNRRTTVCAIDNGKPVAVSLGFTPLEGIMSTRSCGDIDPGIVIYLMKELGYSIYKLDEILKNESGFYGMTGYDTPPDELLKLYGKSDKVTLAFDVYINQITRYIGDYIALLEGFDTVVFSGKNVKAMGQIIFELAKKMSFMGISLTEMPWNTDVESLCITSINSKRHFRINMLEESEIIYRKTQKLVKCRL